MVVLTNNWVNRISIEGNKWKRATSYLVTFVSEACNSCWSEDCNVRVTLLTNTYTYSMFIIMFLSNLPIPSFY